MQRMTPQESRRQVKDLNEKISAWFEPKPTDNPGHLYAKRGEYWDFHKDVGWTSRFDYFTDEAANARLLEAMPEPELWLESSPGEPKRWGCVANISGPPEQFYAEDESRKTAVVMAFCKWVGIETEGL